MKSDGRSPLPLAAMNLRLHAVGYGSRANGPGLRAVLWLQGCTLACAGCFNPETHALQGGYDADTAGLADELLCRRNDLEGVSISGGEPFQQPVALLDLLQRLHGSGMSSLIFSGYTFAEIERRPFGHEILACADVLIAGRYLERRHVGRALLGSANQRVHLLSRRYTESDVAAVPPREVILHADGSMTWSGILSSNGVPDTQPGRPDRAVSRPRGQQGGSR